MNPDYPLAVWTACLGFAVVAFLAVRDAKVKHGWPWTRSKSRHRAPRRATLTGAWQTVTPRGAR